MEGQFAGFTSVSALLVKDGTFAIGEGRMCQLSGIIAMNFNYASTKRADRWFRLQLQFEFDTLV
jgi:hypothetical protein